MITAYGDSETRRKAVEARRGGALHQADRLSRIARRDWAPAGRRDGRAHDGKNSRRRRRARSRRLVRQKFRRQIKEGSIAFGFARDGVEALAFLAERRDFDMVVSDINMPRMDGLTLLAKLQDEATRVSTVIVSAYGDMANIRTAMNRGAFDFLTKPIDFVDFETTLRKTIAHVVGAARRARATGGGGARARLAVTLFLAQPRPQSRRPTPARSRRAASGARSRRCSPTSRGSRRWWNRSTPGSSRTCSAGTSRA